MHGTMNIKFWGLQVYVVTTICFYVAGFASYYGVHTFLTLPRPALQFTLCIVHQCDKPTKCCESSSKLPSSTQILHSMCPSCYNVAGTLSCNCSYSAEQEVLPDAIP